ncbi:hypothetical protein V2J09_004361 [Rumex salicifolius]
MIWFFKNRKQEEHLEDLQVAASVRCLKEVESAAELVQMCVWRRSGKFWGHLVTKRGIEASPDQIREIHCSRESGSFSGIQNMSLILSVSVEGEDLLIYLAVSDTVLIREEGKTQWLDYYLSKTLLDLESQYSQMEKLVFALMVAASKLNHYFQAHAIRVVTSYPIKSLLASSDLSGHVAKYAVELGQYEFSYLWTFTLIESMFIW